MKRSLWLLSSKLYYLPVLFIIFLSNQLSWTKMLIYIDGSCVSFVRVFISIVPCYLHFLISVSSE